MKICLFGGDGRTGSEVIQYAKSKGHDIVVFAFREKNIQADEHITVIQGDVLNADQVRHACTGVDAVISTLGHIKNSDPRMQTKGLKNILDAMQQTNVKRIISLTGTGVRIPEDTPSFADVILNFLVKLIDPMRIADAVEHAHVLQNSSCDWTIVRVLKLTNNQKTVGQVSLTSGGPVELFTSRKKVAQVMIDLLEDKKQFGKMPVISG